MRYKFGCPNELFIQLGIILTRETHNKLHTATFRYAIKYFNNRHYSPALKNNLTMNLNIFKKYAQSLSYNNNNKVNSTHFHQTQSTFNIRLEPIISIIEKDNPFLAIQECKSILIFNFQIYSLFNSTQLYFSSFIERILLFLLFEKEFFKFNFKHEL